VASFNSHDSRPLGEEIVQHREVYLHGTEEHVDLQKAASVGSKCLGSTKGDLFLNELIGEGQVAGGPHFLDRREDEVDKCIRVEGFCGGTGVGGL